MWFSFALCEMYYDQDAALMGVPPPPPPMHHGEDIAIVPNQVYNLCAQAADETYTCNGGRG